jgi:NCS1 family nucleobase:cation symporter-1
MSNAPASTTAPAYGSAVTKIEPFGVDHIPDTERHGRPISQFYVWFAAGLNFPIVLLGFSAISFGLSFTAAITAIGVGAFAGSVLMAVMSKMGVRLGVPQQIQARGPLGFFGNFLPVAYINVFAAIGWAAVTVILGAKAFTELTGIPFWIGALGLTAIELVVSIYGYNMIHYFQRVLSYVLCALFLMITIVALVHGAGTFGANPHAKDYVGATGGWITFAGWFLAFLVAWAPFASDYSRYLPDTPSIGNRTAWYTGLGNFVTIFWLGGLGVLVGGSATSSDSITALHQLTGPFAVPALIGVTLSVLAQNILNIYGGAISIQTLRIPVNRKVAATIVSVLSFLAALWGAAGLEDKFSVFLNLTSYCIAPFAAVLLLDYHIGGRADRSRIAELYDTRRVLHWGFVSWAFGVLVSVPFWQSSLYTGPIAAAHPDWGDLSMYVAAAGAAAGYLLTYRLNTLWSRPAPMASPMSEQQATASQLDRA